MLWKKIKHLDKYFVRQPIRNCKDTFVNNSAYRASASGVTIKVGKIEGSSDSLVQIHGRVLRVNEFTSFLIQEVSNGRSARETASTVNANGLFSARVSEAQIEALIAREIKPLFIRELGERDDLSKIRCKIILLNFEQMRFILKAFEPLFRKTIFIALFDY